MKKAVVLLSGGIDSTTTLAVARSEGYACHAVTFRYGQRNIFEITAAGEIARALGAVKHLVIDVGLSAIGGSALTTDIPVPKRRSPAEMTRRIPITYVPARNIIFLSIALAWAERLQTDTIFIGVNVLDYSGYPDCRPEFIRAFEVMANAGTRAGAEGRPFTIRTPLIDLDKASIIRLGTGLGVNYGLTQSCYDPSPRGKACGACDSCLLRKKGFREAGVKDPTKYEWD